MKKLTVLTATYNRGEYNIPSIQSILNQTYQDFQYIVVDDGSTDDTRKILDSIKHPNLTVIRQENKGFTNTLVDTLQEIDTPYVALNDAADISHPERLERQVKLLDSDRDIGAVGCQIKILSPTGQLLNTWVCPPILHKPLDHLLKFNYFSHGDVMFRHAAYTKAGGYRRFFKYAQDRDLWLRMASFTKLARVNDFLYSQIVLPNAVLADFRKGEHQYLLSAFAVHLAKLRREGKPDELEALGEAAFTRFKNSLDESIKKSVSDKIVVNAEFNYRQTQRHDLMLEAIRRAIEWNPQNPSARKYLKLTRSLCALDRLGLSSLARQLDNLALGYIERRDRKRMTTDLPSK